MPPVPPFWIAWSASFVGGVLNVCAPILEEIAYRAFCRAFKDSSEVGKPNEQLQKDWQNLFPAPGSAGFSVPVGVWDEVSDPKAGDGGSPDAGR